MRIYFDSCVLIYRIEQREPWVSWVNSRLAWVEASGATLVVSELTRMECRVRPMALGSADMLSAFDRFFEQPRLAWQGLDRPVFELATRLRSESRLKTPDALHLAAALIAGCRQFVTNDQRLAQAAANQIDVIAPESAA
jgi:predicted nucleic acid-binding protein